MRIDDSRLGMDSKYTEIAKSYDGYNVIDRSDRLKPEGTYIELQIFKMENWCYTISIYAGSQYNYVKPLSLNIFIVV